VTDEIIFGGDSADIPPGTYPGKLVSVITKTSPAYGDFRAWDFALDEGHVVGGASSMNTGSKSKGGRWIMNLLGRKPEKGENVTSLILGKPCLLVVIEDDDGWPKVDDVLPPLATQQAAAPGEKVRGQLQAVVNELP
jgi:hypothetical protein